jgi:DNA-binding transcriptional regulator LsrR (DeoR family)
MAVSRSRKPGLGDLITGESVSRRSQLSKIAQLYYIENIGQREIAGRMNISIASVSRALVKAKDLDIVRITINTGASDFSQLEIEMENRFSLRECMLVPSFERIERVYDQMAVVAAELLGRVLKQGNTLGVSWGETMKAIGESLPGISISRVDVVPIVGAMGKIETGIYPNSIARTFAEHLGGNAYLVNTPALVDSAETRQSLLADSNFQQVSDLWRRLDMAILGVSNLDIESSAYRGGIFNAAELARMKKAGGVCASNFIIFDAEGRVVDTPISDRIVCLPLPDMKKVRNVVLTAAGPSKVEPLLAMLRSGIATALITDEDCARAILARVERKTQGD